MDDLLRDTDAREPGGPDVGLRLPPRARKPRRQGLTVMIDNGLPMGLFRDVVASSGQLLDLVKFGWGTALVTADLDAKVAALRETDIGYYFGGTLFEKFLSQDRVDGYTELCRRFDCRYVEVSNGTLPMSNAEVASWVRKLADEYVVIAEVGYKQPDRQTLRPQAWVDFIEEDLDAGATLVTTEARESGTAGIAGADGLPRAEVLDAILGSGLDPSRLVFEAPTKTLQTHLIGRLGPDANLGNIGWRDVIALETLRLGLRSDTFFCFG